MTNHWITDLECVLSGTRSDRGTVVPSTRPPLIEGAGARALVAPLMMAFMWSAATFQEQLAGRPWDPLSLALRLLALALTVRTILALRMLVHRMALHRQYARYGLAIASEGLLFRTPAGDTVLPREDILAIRISGEGSRERRRDQSVFVVTEPDTGRTHVTVPPVFGSSPAALAERLQRWLGPAPAPEEGYALPSPSPLPGKLYDQVARGELPRGVVGLRHGAAWLQRAPYASILLSLTVADAFVRTDPAVRAAIGPVVPALCAGGLLFAPLLWVTLVWVDIAPRRGLSLVLTPAEVIMRTRRGTHVIPWRNLDRVHVSNKRTWSLLRGTHERRDLVLQPKSGDTITYAEAFLGEPAEVVAGLCEGYQQGRIRVGSSAADLTSAPPTPECLHENRPRRRGQQL